MHQNKKTEKETMRRRNIDRDRRVLLMYIAGEKTSYIATTCGVSRRSVSKIVRRLGVPPRPRRQPTGYYDKMLPCLRAHVPVPDVARQVGVSETAARIVLAAISKEGGMIG